VRDQAAEYASAWTSFGALERVAAHRADWAAWAAGRRSHTLLMVRVQEPRLVSAIGDVQRRLAVVPGVELHARHFFHVSIQACGFDDALAVDVEAVTAALAVVPSFEVRLGGVNVFHSAVFLETHSGGGLLAVRRAVRAALGPPLEAIDPYPGFLFHLTLGYLGVEADPRQVQLALEPLRECEVGRMRIERVDLVQVPTDQRGPFPELEPVASFALGDG